MRYMNLHFTYLHTYSLPEKTRLSEPIFYTPGQ